MILLPLWSVTVLAVVVTALCYAVWRVWHVQVSVWLIPGADIRKAADELLRMHDAISAEKIASSLCLSAWQRRDLGEAWRWERISIWLRRNHTQEATGK